MCKYLKVGTWSKIEVVVGKGIQHFNMNDFVNKCKVGSLEI
jgi:hypothetical protein